MNAQTWEPKTPTPEDVDDGRTWVASFAESYRTDEAMRRRCESGETAEVVLEHGKRLPPGVEARVVEDTDEVVHMVFPEDPNIELADDVLVDVAGGTQVDEPSTASSVSTLSSAPSCVSSGGTASSAC